MIEYRDDKDARDDTDARDEDDLYYHKDIKVDRGQESLRIDKFLMGRLDKVSRNRVQNAIGTGAILVNEGQVKSNYRVRPGDMIKVILPSDNSTVAVEAEDVPFDILFEDSYVMVVNKPAGLVVHPGIGNHSGTLVNGLMHHYNKADLPLLPGNAPDRPGLVHRIDKDTSGLLVIAKTDQAMTHLAKQFFNHDIDRSYLALVWGNFDELDGKIEGNIGRHPTDRLRMYVDVDGDEGKWALTHYKVIEDMYYVSLVECKLETGRTHQIRVHMNHRGHPVFNDKRYGGDKVVKGTIYTKYKQFVQNCFDLCPRQALHAQTLGFVHPISGETISLSAPPPEDMSLLIQKWRDYVKFKKDLVEYEE